MDISIIIPVYNEESRIIPTLEKIYNYFKSGKTQFEIIVVDDGSKDGTVQVVKKFSGNHPGIRILHHERNRGKGAAVRTGILDAKGELILFSDADLSTPIEEFEKLKKAIDDGYDIAIGSRGLLDSKIIIPQPWYRRYVGKIFPYLVRFIVMKDFGDTQCGFKLFKKEVGKNLFRALKTQGFAFDVEILYRAVNACYKIKEIPVVWINSSDSKVSLLYSPAQMFFSLLKIKKNIR